MAKKKTIRFICSEHGEQDFRQFIYARIILECGCGWYNCNGLKAGIPGGKIKRGFKSKNQNIENT